MAVSNAIPFHIIATPPLQQVGWEIRVLSYKDFITRFYTGQESIPLTVISHFVDCTISPEISGPGAGSITLERNAAFWRTTLSDGSPATTLLKHEHLFQVYDNGLLRFEFLGQTVAETILVDDETQGVVISGPGGADVLRRGKVMSSMYPNAPAEDSDTETTQWNFTRIPVMGCWLLLLAASKKRGTIPYIIPTFNSVVDSAGEPWEDTPLPIPDPSTGTTILAGDVLFNSDQYSLRPSALAAITAMVAKMNDTPTVVLIGHTDSTNTIPYNQTLSENRALSVAAKIRELRPNAVSITTSGKGELQPIATNATAAGRQKNRRVVVSYTNTLADTTDYDTVYEPPMGEDLLALLKELAGEDFDQPAPIRVEWLMRPGFKLDVRRRFGRRREGDVIFYEASTTMSNKSVDLSRDKIANLIAVMEADGSFAIATSQTSIDQWGQREEYSERDASYNDLLRGQIAAKMLEQRKDENASWTIKVPPYVPGRTVFVDYDLGDWIGISQHGDDHSNTVEPFRVLAISLKIDSNGYVELELTLQSKQLSRYQQLQQQITSLIDHGQKGTYTYIQDNEPTGARVGDIWIPKTNAHY